METLTEEDVLVIRGRLADTLLGSDAFGSDRPLYPDRLASAVQRQHTGLQGTMKYTSVDEVAATLFFGLCMGHAFENGNKRTALVAMLVLLERNGALLIDASEDDLYRLATETADHTLLDGATTSDADVVAIAKWIHNHMREAKRGQKPMRFRELRDLLEGLGCEFAHPKNNFIKIRREVDGRSLMVKAGYPNEHHVVPRGEIRRIRQALHLDETSGYDASAFYELEIAVDTFVNKYRQLMNRLGDA